MVEPELLISEAFTTERRRCLEVCVLERATGEAIFAPPPASWVHLMHHPSSLNFSFS